MRHHTNPSPNPIVHVVDDEAAVRKALGLLIKSAGLRAETYDSAQDFLYRYRPNGPGCLVLDIRMPEMDGLELQSRLQENSDTIPIIMITGQGDIPMAVCAIKRGALDFIEKPFPEGRLLELIEQALDRDREQRALSAQHADINARIASLTRREQDVLAGLTQGKQSKAIAADLDISPRTVEAHRSHILHKLGVHTQSELLRMTLRLEEHDGRKGSG